MFGGSRASSGSLGIKDVLRRLEQNSMVNGTDLSRTRRRSPSCGPRSARTARSCSRPRWCCWSSSWRGPPGRRCSQGRERAASALALLGRVGRLVARDGPYIRITAFQIDVKGRTLQPMRAGKQLIAYPAMHNCDSIFCFLNLENHSNQVKHRTSECPKTQNLWLSQNVLPTWFKI